MKEKYYSILSQFLNKTKRERVLFELQSKKKRENAFAKITDFSEYFNAENIFCDLSHFEDDVAVEKLNQLFGNITCYNLLNDEVETLSTAYIGAVNSYMANVLIVDENTIVYVGECEVGASPKYILKK